MSKLTNREKGLLVFAILLIAGFSIYNWGIAPLWKDYNQTTAALAEAKRTYTKALNTTRAEEELAQRHTAYSEAYQEMLTHYYVGIEEQEAKIKFLALVEDLIEESQVQIVSKNIGTGSLEEGFKTVEINLTLKGSSDQMTNLLLAFRGAPVAINVERLRIDLDSRNRLLQMRLTVSTPIIGEVGDQDGTEK